MTTTITRAGRRRRSLCFLVLSLLCLASASKDERRIDLIRGRSNRQARLERLQASLWKDARCVRSIRGGSNRQSRLERLRSTAHEDSTGVAAMAGGRRACGFYIWDAPSALLHKWCTHLMKDCVYEGRGGHKFVRIEPGSILQLLYPCSRYSPDRCFICGGTYRDHLTLWWSKHMYRPYDRIVDKVYEEGVIFPPADEPTKGIGRRDGKKKTDVAPPLSPPKPEYVFHRRYVGDDASSPSPQPKGARQSSSPKMQKRTVLTQFQSVSYQVPAVDTNGPKTVMIARNLVLWSLDQMIRREATDRLRWKPTH